MKYSPEAAFVQDLCVRCGECALVCPTGAVVGGRGDLPRFLPGRCIACSHCAGICPVAAYGPAGAAVEGPDCSPEAFMRLCSVRRSIRRFERRTLDALELARLLGPVGYSPTGVNASGIRVAAVDGEDVRKFLFEPLRSRMDFLWRTGILRAAGAVSGMTGMIRRIVSGEDLVFREAPLVLFFFVPRKNPTARTDGAIAATLVMMNAQAMGLGTLWNGIAERAYPLMRPWRLREGKGCILTAVLCAGYPAVKLRTLPPRDWHFGRGVPGECPSRA